MLPSKNGEAALSTVPGVLLMARPTGCPRIRRRAGASGSKKASAEAEAFLDFLIWRMSIANDWNNYAF